MADAISETETEQLCDNHCNCDKSYGGRSITVKTRDIPVVRTMPKNKILAKSTHPQLSEEPMNKTIFLNKTLLVLQY